MKEYILAIDHEKSGIKSAIVSTHGEIIDFEFEPTQTFFTAGGGAVQDPDDWWKAMLKSSSKLIKKKKAYPKNIIALSVSSTLSSTIAVDQKGNYLMNSLTYIDSRGAPYIKQIAGGYPSVKGYNIFKALRWTRITGGGPQLSGKDNISHAVFIQNEYPRIYDKTYKFLSSRDYLNMRLTGEFAATPDSIMLFWCTDNRDINNIKYSDKLMKQFGMNREKLPDLISSDEICGTLKPEIARKLGLSKNLKVAMGAPGHQAALIGSGAVNDFEGHLYTGTSSWIECIVPFKKTDMFHSIASMPSAIPGKYQCINEQDLAEGCLQYLLKNMIFHKNEFSNSKNIKEPYKKLEKIVSQIQPGSEKIIFTPWLNGERTPVNNNSLRGGFHNLSTRSTIDHMARAVMEGVVYNTKWSIKYVEKFIGKKFESLNIIGEGANSNTWCQIFSDVLGRKIRQVKNPTESNARGAAFIASVAMKKIKFNDITGLIKFENEFEPSQDNMKIYDELYREFLTIYKQNKDIYKRLNSKSV